MGTPNEVYNHSATEFVCNFIGDINRLEPEAVRALNQAGGSVDPAARNYIRLERIHVNVEPKAGAEDLHQELGAEALGTCRAHGAHLLLIPFTAARPRGRPSHPWDP